MPGVEDANCAHSTCSFQVIDTPTNTLSDFIMQGDGFIKQFVLNMKC